MSLRILKYNDVPKCIKSPQKNIYEFKEKLKIVDEKSLFNPRISLKCNLLKQA
jgi:hypothetical protein